MSVSYILYYVDFLFCCCTAWFDYIYVMIKDLLYIFSLFFLKKIIVLSMIHCYKIQLFYTLFYTFFLESELFSLKVDFQIFILITDTMRGKYIPIIPFLQSDIKHNVILLIYIYGCENKFSLIFLKFWSLLFRISSKLDWNLCSATTSWSQKYQVLLWKTDMP